MSLFSTVDFWSTQCGENETFSFSSLVTVDINESGNDEIIVGSFSGLLRIYQVIYNDSEETSFKPSDLLLESQLPDGIIQIVVGRLVSGSTAVHIGVVHSKSIGVYNFSSIPGSTEHGNQFELRLVYEHSLQHINYHVIMGPFGCVKNRDFLCAVAVDGTLSFFEQETFVFEAQLPMFLLPSPIAYIEESDVFVTLSADWYIEGYRYQDLVNTVKKKVVASWAFNLGETLLDIKSIRNNILQETYTVALSEHNVTCFNENGIVKFTKRLQYTPHCLHIYINEYNNNLMLLIISDCGTLFIYEKCTLRWSAKLQTIPLCISRAKLGISGSLVLLSGEGELVCCFLGTKPNLFEAPPLEDSVTSFKNTNKRLENVQERIKNFKNNNNELLSLPEHEKEISVVLKVLPFDKTLNHCQVVTDLNSSCPLSNIHVTFEMQPPFCVNPPSFTLSTLYEKIILNSFVQINTCKEIVPTNLDICSVISYVGSNAPRIIKRYANISSRFVLFPSTVTEEECPFRINVQTNKPPIVLSTLFKEFRDDVWVESGCNDNTVSFCLRYNPNKKCIISLSDSEYGYNFASNSIPMLQLLLSQVTFRCKNIKITSEKHFSSLVFSCEYIPKDELVKIIDEHLTTRKEIQKLQSLLEKLSSQFRLIQRRLLIKLKDKILSNISALRLLFESTYEKIIEVIHALEEKQDELLSRSCDLQATINLTFDLMLMNNRTTTEKVVTLRNAMTSTIPITDTQGWEERTLTNVTHLLRTVLANSSRDQYRVLPAADKMVSDSAHLTSTIMTAIDRLIDPVHKDITRGVSPILEDNEFEENHIEEKQFKFIKHQKLLSKRQ